MRVLCCGPESSGTRLLTRIVNTANGVTAIHRSLPHWEDWELIPDDITPIDRAVFITRNWNATIMSQLTRGLTSDRQQSVRHLRRAHATFYSEIGDMPWWHVNYGELVRRPDIVLSDLSDFLGSEVTLPEGVYDGDRRWVKPEPPTLNAATQAAPEPSPPQEAIPTRKRLDTNRNEGG